MQELKILLETRNSLFWKELEAKTKSATSCHELILLNTLRKKAAKQNFAREGILKERLKIALLSGYSTHPLDSIIEHLAFISGMEIDLFLGDFNNFHSEILNESSLLYKFSPEVTILLPGHTHCNYLGQLTDTRDTQELQAIQVCESILSLCSTLYTRTRSEILLGNFLLPRGFDLGSYRTKTLGSSWSFRKRVNLEIGLRSPSYVHICDLEFLAFRRGALQTSDDRGWYESKQIGAPDFLVDIAKESVHLVHSLTNPPKKVLVVDLDNTLWGGAIGDDGIEGIILGDTSSTGEAFKSFQKYILSLMERGTLLAVCSKNTEVVAKNAFLQHPEMVLKLNHFVSFKANWDPKSDNIRRIAEELNLGLESFVFIDDNPAEIEIVRQFLPQVSTILLGDDPSTFISKLEDSRYFEPKSITKEDALRTKQYQIETERKLVENNSTDIRTYLESLQMKAVVSEFTSVDIPRIAQLINKSNQFNVTTKRRTEADVLNLLKDNSRRAFSVRLSDKFGDHGLISVVILEKKNEIMEVDTWLMSCRVLKRQVEEAVTNEIIRLAKIEACEKVVGLYKATLKNEMVKNLFLDMGFILTKENETARTFELDISSYIEKTTAIDVERRFSGASNGH